jgi:hypothetical protein
MVCAEAVFRLPTEPLSGRWIGVVRSRAVGAHTLACLMTSNSPILFWFDERSYTVSALNGCTGWCYRRPVFHPLPEERVELGHPTPCLPLGAVVSSDIQHLRGLHGLGARAICPITDRVRACAARVLLRASVSVYGVPPGRRNRNRFLFSCAACGSCFAILQSSKLFLAPLVLSTDDMRLWSCARHEALFIAHVPHRIAFGV